MLDHDLPARVARALIEIDAVKFTPRQPITFRSGMRSPVYVDNRRLPFSPLHWQLVITSFDTLIARRQIQFDVIAGIEAAGIPHSAALAYSLRKPSVFVRKQTKGHGTQGRIEGGDVSGRRVLLIEDHVTTGGSSLAGVAALREDGARVEECLAITSYDFVEAADAFSAAGVNLHLLAPFEALVEQAYQMGRFTAKDLDLIYDWIRDPHGWAIRQGHSA
jgi:orotate phosphoribosyltransferase